MSIGENGSGAPWMDNAAAKAWSIQQMDITGTNGKAASVLLNGATVIAGSSLAHVRFVDKAHAALVAAKVVTNRLTVVSPLVGMVAPWFGVCPSYVRQGAEILPFPDLVDFVVAGYMHLTEAARLARLNTTAPVSAADPAPTVVTDTEALAARTATIMITTWWRTAAPTQRAALIRAIGAEHVWDALTEAL
jgi:hypothetical protein